MAKVSFDLEGNFEPALSGATKFNASLEQTKKLETQVRDGFKSNAKEAENFGKKAQGSAKIANEEYKKLGNGLSQLLGNLPFSNAIQGTVDLGKSAKETVGGIGQMGSAWKGLDAIFKRSIIGLIIAAIVGLIAAVTTFFRVSENGGDKMARIMSALGVVVNQVTKFFSKMGEIAVDAFETMLEPMGKAYDFIVDKFFGGIQLIADGLDAIGFDGASNKLEGFGQRLRKASEDNQAYIKSLIDIGVEIANMEDSLEDATIAVGLQNEKLKTKIDQTLKALRNQSNSYEENIKLIEEVSEAEQEKLSNSISLIEQQIAIEKKRYVSQAQDQAKAAFVYDQFVDGQITAQEIIAELDGTNTTATIKNIADILAKREQATRESMVLDEKLNNYRAQNEAKETAKREKALQDRLRLLEKYTSLESALLNAAEKARIDALTGEQKFAAIREAELKEIEIVKQSIEDLNVQLNRKKDLTKAQSDQVQILRDQANARYLTSLREFNKAEIAETQAKKSQQLDLYEQIEIEKINGLKNSGLSEVAFEKFKQEEILRVQIDAAQKRLALIENDGTQETQLRRLQLENFITDAEGKLEELNQSKKFSLAEALGFTDAEFSSVTGALTQLKDNVLGIYKDMFDQQIEMNRHTVESLNTTIAERERALDREIEIANLGLASNVATEKQKLEEEKKRRDAALKAQEEAQKKKQRLETIEQTIGLITSAANIFKSLSGIPFVGIPLAIGVIGTMFAAFASAKSKASKAVKLEKGGELGGEIIAPSHAQGGHKVMTSKGIYEIEGKEWITNKKSSKKHTRLLSAINRDNERDIVEAMLPYLSIGEEGIRLNKAKPLKTIKKSTKKPSITNFEGMITYLSKIATNTGKIQDRHIVAVPDGATLIEYTRAGKRTIKNV